MNQTFLRDSGLPRVANPSHCGPCLCATQLLARDLSDQCKFQSRGNLRQSDFRTR